MATKSTTAPVPTDDASLKDKAIKIKGKAYVLVSDRVIYFNEHYPKGCIETEELPDDSEADRVKFKATVTPDVNEPLRRFTGHSQAVWGDGNVNTTAATENAETSAVGRALAMMGIGVIDSIASIDEINKAKHPSVATPKQIAWMREVARKVSGLEHNDDVDEWLARPDVLSIAPQQVPVFKVKDAVDRIYAIGKADTAAQEAKFNEMIDDIEDGALDGINDIDKDGIY